ncbi:MAG: PAS domain S-box protein, partial [Gemmatimonadetes bacterium]|nr:PAS domain S-box protein [Gemmatimonadota bacterium]
FPAVVTRMSDNTVVAINQYTSELFGVAQAEAIGQSVLQYYVDANARQRLADAVRRYGRAEGFRFHVRRRDGSTFWVLASARLVTFKGEPAILTVFSDITDQLAAEQALMKSEQRLVTQSKVLTELTGRHADRRGGFEDELRDILRATAETLAVERVSMWRIDEGRGAIHCVCMFHRSTKRFESGAVLPREAAPEYFEALERDRVIAAEDVVTDRRTREFKESYLVPNGIGAMLDVPLRQEDQMYGVLCSEHVGSRRDWMMDEQNFAVSAANLIVVAATDEERRVAVARLAESDALAQVIVDAAHDAFVGTDGSGQIVTWNTQAERLFGWTRTEVVGRQLADVIIPPALRDASTTVMQRFVDAGGAPDVNTRTELTALHRDGREIPIDLTITSPMRLGKGSYVGAFVREIPQRRGSGPPA